MRMLNPITKIKTMLSERIGARLYALLQQNIAPPAFALSISTGMVMGLLPIPWISVLLCIIIAFLFRLNQIATQLANYAAYPVQLVCLYPFSLLGRLFVWPEREFSADFLHNLLQSDAMYIMQHFGAFFAQAIVGWVLLAPVLLLIFYRLILLLLRRRTLAASNP